MKNPSKKRVFTTNNTDKIISLLFFIRNALDLLSESKMLEANLKSVLKITQNKCNQLIELYVITRR